MRTSAATAAGKRRASARTPQGRHAPRRAPKARSASRQAPRRASGATRRPARRGTPARRPARRSSINPGALAGRLDPGTWRGRGLLLVAIAGALALGYFGWFRDSSFVAVRDVEVDGIESSADRGQIVAALTDAARGMTTLHVQTDRLVGAVQGFPTVASVSADPGFPNGMTIHVTERQPALLASDGTHEIPVAADGSLLPGLEVGEQDLPRLAVESLPAAGRLSGEALDEALAVGAAPGPLRSLIVKTSVSPEFGVLIALQGGIELRFGSGRQSAAKWSAVAAILADPGLTSLSYVNVRVPGRPAVG